MLKIGTKDDCKMLSHLPLQVQKEVEDTIEMLNQHYGEHRNIDEDMRGYVLIIEDSLDYVKAKDIFNQPIYELIPEYVKKIPTKDRCYTKSLIIANNDYAVTIITTLFLTPLSFLQYIEVEENEQ